MKKAAEWCEQGIGLERNSLHFHLTLGRAKAFGGDLNGACECLERCVSLVGSHVNPLTVCHAASTRLDA